MSIEIDTNDRQGAAERASTYLRVGDPQYWRERFERRYRAGVGGTHDRLWRSALRLLIRHGAPRVFTDGSMDAHPRSAALSTGVMAVGEVRKWDDAHVAVVARLSTADPALQYTQLPMSDIRSDVKRGDVGLARAVRRLSDFPDLTSIRFDAMMVATRRSILSDRRSSVSGEVEQVSVTREVALPWKIAAKMSSGKSCDGFASPKFNQLLNDKPEVALWSVPLERFGGVSHAFIKRPQVPALKLPEEARTDEYSWAVEDALARAKGEQPHAEEMLRTFNLISEPMRALGSMAIINLRDEL